MEMTFSAFIGKKKNERFVTLKAWTESEREDMPHLTCGQKEKR